MLKVYIENNPNFFPELKYIWELFCFDRRISFVFVSDKDSSEISIGDTDDFTIRVNSKLFPHFGRGSELQDLFLSGDCCFYLDDGSIDYLASAFYLVSCSQELGQDSKDEFGRYRYSDSLQYKSGKASVDLVTGFFQSMCINFPVLGKASLHRDNVSGFWLSHDIDTLYGSLLQDGFYCIKKARIWSLIQLIYTDIFKHKAWMNVDRILEIERQFGFASMFFWLPVHGMGRNRIKNADYRVSDESVQKLIKIVSEYGGENGIHKSASSTCFEEEMKNLKFRPFANRYHFLAFDPQKDYYTMEKVGIEFDSSLSFAEFPSFRNSYSKPFFPYLFKERRSSSVLECPMHIMDTTFFNYLKMDKSSAYNFITDFLLKSNSGAVLGILWHNNFISDHKYSDYSDLYFRVLNFLKANNNECLLPSQLLLKYKSWHTK